MDLRYDSIAALIEAAKQSGRKLSELVLEQQAVQMEQSADELYEIMRKSYAVMAASVEEGKAPGVRSASGLSGGDAYRMARAEREGNVLCGGVFSGALTRALAVSEWNAAMGRIVAAPTAGSCGILPAAVLTLQAERKLPERACVMSLFTASAVGMVIANNACIAGAQGGCQAECGSAAAMAAAALVELCGGARICWATRCPSLWAMYWALCVTLWPVLWKFPASTAMRQAWRALLLRRSSRWLAFAALSPPMKRSSR